MRKSLVEQQKQLQEEKRLELQRQLDDLNDQKSHLVGCLDRVEMKKVALEQKLGSQGDILKVKPDTMLSQADMVALLHQKANEMNSMAESMEAVNGKLDKQIDVLFHDIGSKLNQQAEDINSLTLKVNNLIALRNRDPNATEYFNAMSHVDESELSLAD